MTCKLLRLHIPADMWLPPTSKVKMGAELVVDWASKELPHDFDIICNTPLPSVVYFFYKYRLAKMAAKA
jgi:hypothetical protein